MDKPSLMISVRTEIDKALEEFQRNNDGAKKAGEGTKKGMEVAKEGTKHFHRSVANGIKTQMRMGDIPTGANTISSEFKRAADYCKNLATEFSDLRQAMQQVAALKCQSKSKGFTVDEAKKATAIILTPTEWKSFQEQFQSYGGTSPDGDQAQFKDREDISTNKQAEQYEQPIIHFARAHGILTAEVAQLGDALPEFSEGPQTVDTLMSRTGNVYKTLNQAPTPLFEFMPQMSCITTRRASPEEASSMLAIMSEAMPDEEETVVTNALKARNDQILKRKGTVFGQPEDITPLQKHQAAATAIKDRVDNGEQLKAILADVASNIRKMKRLDGFVAQVLEAEAFERIKGCRRDTPASFVQQTLQDFEATDSGQKAKPVAQETLAKAQDGAKYQHVLAALQLTKTTMIKSGELDEGSLANYSHDALGRWSGAVKEQHKINTQAIENLRERGGHLNRTNPEFEGPPAGNVFGQGGWSQYSVNMEIRDLLKRIEEKTGKNPVLTALPAGHSGARQVN